MAEDVNTSETSVNFYQTTRLNIPEDSHLERPAWSYSARSVRRRLCINEETNIVYYEIDVLGESKVSGPLTASMRARCGR
jgi:hypothetical protein